MHYQTVTPENVEIVASVVDGYYFVCPDLAALDSHLVDLRTRFLGPGANTTDERKAKARTDIDRLLERRLYLQMTDQMTDAA